MEWDVGLYNITLYIRFGAGTAVVKVVKYPVFV